MAEVDAYNEAVKTGQYQKPSGLLGKYDNVRRFWEDEELGLYLRPYIEPLVTRQKTHGKKLRLLDIGCGSGDGFEMITAIDSSKSLVSEHNTKLIDSDTIELYKGIDVNAALLAQAQTVYHHRQDMVFVESDYNEFDFDVEEPYDLYLANYGTLSHNTDENTIELLSKIVRHGKNGAVIIIDWLGRYSYEWQTLWTNDVKHNQWMDYVISYIYSDSEQQQDLTSFPLRIMGRGEVQDIYRQVKRRVGKAIKLHSLADRSSFVGRHMGTVQYNPHSQPMRGIVNSLFEPNICTNLDEVLIKYVPRDGFAEVNAYHQKLTDCWNYLINYTKALLEGNNPPELMATVPRSLRKTLSIMRSVAGTASRMKTGNPRASLVEPQLGYCLRELEMGLQRGLGCGHGLVAIFELVK